MTIFISKPMKNRLMKDKKNSISQRGTFANRMIFIARVCFCKKRCTKILKPNKTEKKQNKTINKIYYVWTIRHIYGAVETNLLTTVLYKLIHQKFNLFKPECKIRTLEEIHKE